MNAHARAHNRAAWLAAAWAVAFAVPSFFWAAGGNWGLGTIAKDPQEALGSAAEGWVVALTGLLKLSLGGFALSFDFPGVGTKLRRARIFAGLVASALLIAYGLLVFIDHLTMVVGMRSAPPALGDYAARWHAFFWDPVWLAGGLLLGLAVRNYAASTRG